jgi:hypothetical protein
MEQVNKTVNFLFETDQFKQQVNINLQRVNPWHNFRYHCLTFHKKLQDYLFPNFFMNISLK